MNVFIKAMLVRFLKSEETELKQRLQTFLVAQGDKLIEDVLQPGTLREGLEKFLAENVTTATDYLFGQAVAFLEGL